MQIDVNSRGQRVFVNGPYIDQSELHRNVELYDPNGPGWNTGLYKPAKPNTRKDLAGRTCCSGWLPYMRKESKHIPPQKGFDQKGNVYLFGYSEPVPIGREFQSRTKIQQ